MVLNVKTFNSSYDVIIEKGVLNKASKYLNLNRKVLIVTDNNIPESYIESLPARLQIYRRIAEIKTDEHAEDVMDELIDRFGEPPVAVLGLIDIALLRNRASEMGIYEINDKNGGMVIYFKEFSKEIASKLMAAPELKGRVMLSYSEKPYITIRMKKEHDPLDTLKCVLDILQY